MKETAIFGSTDIFAIECKMFRDEHETELSMYVLGRNILAFKRAEETLTTRWNLDDLTEWLRNFLNKMQEDPYPVECDGEYAAMKDVAARNFDSDNDDEFDAYYDRLDKWNESHRWHPASNGAILADVYFQLHEDNVEISWNNLEEEVSFEESLGGASIPKEKFESVVNDFLRFYADFWF